MFKKLKLGSKIFAGFLMLLVLMIVAGGVGVVSLRSVGNALHVVASEETPLVIAASGMELSLVRAQDTLGEFRISTSTMGRLRPLRMILTWSSASPKVLVLSIRQKTSGILSVPKS